MANTNDHYDDLSRYFIPPELPDILGGPRQAGPLLRVPSSPPDSWDDTLRGPKQALVERPKRTIWKYQIPVLEDFTVDLPEGAEIIRFANENGMLWLWAVVNPDAPIVPRRLLAFKTGAEMPDMDLTYLGCAAIYIQAELMLYYFEETVS